MKWFICVFLTLVCLAPCIALAGGGKEGGSVTRTSYLAERGTIVSPEEVLIDSYIASIDFGYPKPLSSLLGVSLYSGHRQLSIDGQEEIIQIGIQGGKKDFGALPPMNLAFVIDHSGSMADANKLDWVKDAFDIFIEQVRDVDYVSLVIFNSDAWVVFPATKMDSRRNRMKFQRAVHSIQATGSTNIRAGLLLGCLEVVKNLNREYVNRVMFLSDGCDTCGNTHYDILELAKQFCAEGVTISTIGVGSSFDLELMVDMADVGGGSSRFISDREEMEKTFGSELDRMVVPLAKNLEMTLEFLLDVEVLDTWGYENRRSGDTIRYFLPTLHHGDYETILVQIWVPQQRYTGTADLVRFSVQYEDAYGNRYWSEPHILQTNFVEMPYPVTGFTDGRVLQSGTILHFAQNLKKIGDLCNSGASNVNIERALAITLKTKKELVNAKMRLDYERFDDEIRVLDRYLEILGRELNLAEYMVSEITRDVEMAPMVLERPLPNHLKNLCREIGLDLKQKGRGVVAFCGFASQGNSSQSMVELLSDMVFNEIGRISALTLVEHYSLTAILEEKGFSQSDLTDKLNALAVGRSLAADYIMTGSVIETANTYIVFSRLLNVKTGEVESAAQVIVARS